jgi:hypothetical protein
METTSNPTAMDPGSFQARPKEAPAAAEEGRCVCHCFASFGRSPGRSDYPSPPACVATADTHTRVFVRRSASTRRSPSI